MPPGVSIRAQICEFRGEETDWKCGAAADGEGDV